MTEELGTRIKAGVLTMPHRTALEQRICEATDKGLLIKAGWLSYRLSAVPIDASPEVIKQINCAFFSGAHHLFQSLIAILNSNDATPSEEDLARMNLISEELKNFVREFEAQHLPTRGSA
jgi:hypothetical protein